MTGLLQLVSDDRFETTVLPIPEAASHPGLGNPPFIERLYFTMKSSLVVVGAQGQ